MLSKNLLTVDYEEIPSAEVEMTFVGGELRYKNKQPRKYLIKTLSQLIYKNYISGEFKSSDNLFDDISPFDGSIVAEFQRPIKLMLIWQ